MVKLHRGRGFTRLVVLLFVLVALIMVVCVVPMLLRPRKTSYQASFAPAAINPAQEVDSKSLRQTAVVATLDCPLPEHNNAIWCSTFQMAWDKLKADIIGEPIELLGAVALASRLNRRPFPTRDIEPQSYYANAGFVRDGILEQIRKDMASRFPSEAAPEFDDRYRTLPEVAVAYAYLSVNIGFKHAYFVNNRPFAFTASNRSESHVTSFCTYGPGPNPEDLREQVDILFYRDAGTAEAREFAVDLCTHTKPYQVILARVPQCDTLGEAAKAMQERIAQFQACSDYQTLREFRPIDTLTAPDVFYRLTHHFDELMRKKLANPKWPETAICEALQKIDFVLSRTGVVLKSESRVATVRASRDGPPRETPRPRDFRFDRPFLVCIKKRQANATPFFLMWVDNAELMQAMPRDP
jgi:hypothetical protein